MRTTKVDWIVRPMTIGLTVLALSACATKAGGPPEIQIDRTACSHCTMLVSEVAYAAAYQQEGSRARVFDDIGCLLEGMRRDGIRDSRSAGLRVWFHDAGDGQWIEGAGAVFVVSPEIRTPMGGGIVAYRDTARAGPAAAKFRGRLVRSLGDLIDRQGDE